MGRLEQRVPIEVAGLRGWIDPKILSESSLELAGNGEGLGLSLAPIEREHEPSGHRLVVRILLDEGSELWDQLAVATQSETDLHPGTERLPVQPLQVHGTFADDRRIIGQVGERRSPQSRIARAKA